MKQQIKGFGSDNFSGIAPEILQALIAANQGHVAPYGNDPYTQALNASVKETFGSRAEAFCVFTGTAANTLALKTMLRSHHAVITTDIAHTYTLETGAPVAWTGASALVVPHQQGKLTPQAIEKVYLEATTLGKHQSLPKAVSIAQTTEVGTVYTLDEIKALKAMCKRYDLYLYMDGARLSNAAVTLNVSLKTLAEETEVDALSCGGTKNGLLGGELLLFMNPSLAHEFEYMQKQGLQLASKMRFLSAQFLPYLQEGLWHRYASHANAMAQKLAEGLSRLPGVRFPYGPQQSNQFWVDLPRAIVTDLQAAYPLYDRHGLIRLVTSFDTMEEEVTGFIQLAKKLIEQAS